MIFPSFEISFSIDVGLFIIVFLSLLIFGGLYNQFVEYMDKLHYTEGYLSLVVAFGVFVTLIGVSILSWQAALMILVCFIASGTPMIVGSITRYIRKRADDQNSIRKVN